MELPNREKASIPPSQVRDYLLSETHVGDRGKAKLLGVTKIYQVLPDDKAAKHQLIRVIDESGEDYLYPIDFFVPINVPAAAEKVFALAA